MRLAVANHAELKKLHGTDFAHWCKDCAHLLHVQAGNTPCLKCRKARVTASAASDWRAMWQACGLFAQAAGSTPAPALDPEKPGDN